MTMNRYHGNLSLRALDILPENASADDLHLDSLGVDGPCVSGTGRGDNGDCGRTLQEVAFENLSEQVRELKDVNARLLRSVHEKDREMERLRETALKSASDSMEREPVQPKIVELAKAKRDMTAKYEAEHSRVQQLKKEKAELEKRITELPCGDTPNSCAQDHLTGKGRSRIVSPGKSDSNLRHESECSWSSMSSIQQRARSTSDKAAVVNHENQCLRQQLAKLQKLLERELGPGVDVTRLMKEEFPSFRGRHEQIQVLKGKVDTLKKQLEAFRALDPEPGSSKVPDQKASEKLQLRVDDYHLRSQVLLASTEHRRREEFTALELRYTELQRSHADLKTKMTAEKARNEYLSKENVRLTQFNRHVLSTCQKDAELIRYFQTTIADLRTTLSQVSPAAAPGALPPLVLGSDSRRSSVRSTNETEKVSDELQRKIQKMENEIICLKKSNQTFIKSLKQDSALTAHTSGDSQSEKDSSVATPHSPPPSITWEEVEKDSLDWSRYEDPNKFPSGMRTKCSSSPSMPGRVKQVNFEPFSDLAELGQTVLDGLQTRLRHESEKMETLREQVAVSTESNGVLQLEVDHLRLRLENPTTATTVQQKQRIAPGRPRWNSSSREIKPDAKSRR